MEQHPKFSANNLIKYYRMPVVKNIDYHFLLFASPSDTAIIPEWPTADCFTVVLADHEPVEVKRLDGDVTGDIQSRVVNTIAELRNRDGQCLPDHPFKNYWNSERQYGFADVYAGSYASNCKEIVRKRFIDDLWLESKFGKGKARVLAELELGKLMGLFTE